MLITELAEDVQSRLATGRDDWAPPDRVVTPKVTIDWVTDACQPGFKVLVIPELNQYLADETNSREYIKTLQITKYLSILVGYTFEKPTIDDTAATWEETKYILDTRERIEIFLLRETYQDVGLLITDIESQPVNEQELDRRNFNAITSIGFNQQLCGSTQEYNSMRRSSNNAIELVGEKASMRHAALSERRLGRR